MRDLPNMGVKERGLPDAPESPPGELSPASSIVSIPGHLEAHSAASVANYNTRLGRHANGAVAAGVGVGVGAAGGPIGWSSKLGKLVWEKWTWGVFMLVAILVARFSS
jgi:ubiquitin-conjugating enzyme E2 J2